MDLSELGHIENDRAYDGDGGFESGSDMNFDELCDDVMTVLPESEDPSAPRHNPFLRVAYGRKLLSYDQERELGRRLGDARQAMTEGLARFSASTALLSESWEQALAGDRSPGDVLQWPCGTGDGDAEGGSGSGMSSRQRMSEMALRHSCWVAEHRGRVPLEAPMDLRKMFMDAAPAFPMLCEMRRAARESLDLRRSPRDRDMATLTRTLEGVDAAELRFQEARRVMLECNLRLVFSIAGKFVNNGIAYDDLVQEGIIGLMRAVEKFDQSLGFKFSTYASNWIWQAVTRAIANQRRTVRVPAHIHDKMIRVRSIAASMERESGRSPTVRELAEAANLSPEVINRALNAANRSMSLDAPVRSGEETTFLDLTPDNGLGDTVDEIHQGELSDIVRELLSELPRRESTILHLRLGLDGTDTHTLEEIGEILGITRERTRQLQNRALQTLRARLTDSGVSLA